MPKSLQHNYSIIGMHQSCIEAHHVRGIGNPETNNGVLLLLISDIKRLEIEIGMGLEELLPFWW